MSSFFFKILAFLLTVIGFVFPNINNVDYDRLPITFEIESINDIYVPEDEYSTSVQEYPTIVRLCHQENEADNGKLLAAFEKWADTYPIYSSEDDGETWNYLCTVRDNLNEGYWNEWMPFLYELPADVGEF